MLNLDTHILIDFVRGALEPKELNLIRAHEDELFISDIVLWEIAKLNAKKKITLPLKSSEMKRVMHFIHILPITAEIADQSTKMDFDSDSADELIAATSLIHNMPLLTRDQKIRKSKMLAWS